MRNRERKKEEQKIYEAEIQLQICSKVFSEFFEKVHTTIFDDCNRRWVIVWTEKMSKFQVQLPYSICIADAPATINEKCVF